MPDIPPDAGDDPIGRARTRILDAAFEIFQRTKYGDVKLASIAARAGLARNSLYRYFPNKNSILFESVVRHFEKVMEGNDATLRKIDDPAQRIEAWADLVVDFITGPTQDMVELLYSVPLKKKDLRAAMHHGGARVIATLRVSYARIMTGQGKDIDLCMAMLDGMVRAAAHHARRGRPVEQTKLQLREAIRAVLRLAPQPGNRVRALGA